MPCTGEWIGERGCLEGCPRDPWGFTCKRSAVMLWVISESTWYLRCVGAPLPGGAATALAATRSREERELHIRIPSGPRVSTLGG